MDVETVSSEAVPAGEAYCGPYAASRQESRAVRRIARTLAKAPVPFELVIGGRVHRLGEGPAAFRVIANDRAGLAALGSLDQGRIAEAYMSSAIDLEGDMLRFLALRDHLPDSHPLHFVWRFLHPLLVGQVSMNATAIRHHYDRDAEFFLAFLGEPRCYTQAVFERDDEPFEAAFRRKFDFLISACGLKPGSRILEVGPGWGAFAEYAGQRGIHFTGITNSRYSQRYMEELGSRLRLPLRIVFGDIFEYRPQEHYDAVVIMGVTEHLPQYRRLLRKCAELLRPGGHVFLDAIAARVKYLASSFIYRHIFPGNHSFLLLHDFLAAVAKSRFVLRGVHDDQWSYFLTFCRWARNFEANRERVVARFGEQEYRRFQLYLWGSAHGFLSDRLQCYRMVLDYPGPG
jgi:cyclopropane-fatty-acyl-phospholipid synthase